MPDEWESEPLVPGDYTVRVGAGSGDADTVFILPMQAVAQVVEGRDTRLELVAERGVAQNVKVTTQAAEPPKTLVIIRDVLGAEVARDTVYWSKRGEDSVESVGWVGFVGRPGTYALRVECGGTLVVERDFMVAGGVNFGPDVEVPLP